MATRSNDIILDSCAGSGTTAHAVLALNADDGGNRRFVLIQQRYDSKTDEAGAVNICERVTAERVRRVINGTNTKTLPGSFTYARLSDTPILGDYRTYAERETLPSYDEIAAYVFYTETGREWYMSGRGGDGSHKIAEYAGTSYYLLYTPNKLEDAALTIPVLEEELANDPNERLVVYCEKVWLHRDDRLNWQDETGKTLRPMLVPFHLK